MTPASPRPAGTQIVFTAAATGCANPEYQFWTRAPNRDWAVRQPYSRSGTFTWNTTDLAPGTYHIAVWARQQGPLPPWGCDSYPFVTSYALVTSYAITVGP